MNWEWSGMGRRDALMGRVLLLCVLLLSVAAPAAQAEISSLTFNAELSLTGTCETDSGDEVIDPWCPGPPGPSASFDEPNIEIDSFGDMYVGASDRGGGSSGLVDVFSPTGQFLTEISLPRAGGSLAVDGEGNLYVFLIGEGERQVVLVEPEVYDPLGSEILYGAPQVVIANGSSNPFSTSCTPGGLLSGETTVAIDPLNDHLYVRPGECVGEFGSAAEGNPPLDLTIGSGTGGPGTGVLTGQSRYLAVDAAHNRLYVSNAEEFVPGSTVAVFELAAPHGYLGMLDGSDTPAERFRSPLGQITLAADEETGHMFVSDLNGSIKRV